MSLRAAGRVGSLFAVLAAAGCQSDSDLVTVSGRDGWTPGGEVSGWPDFDCTSEDGTILQEFVQDPVSVRIFQPSRGGWTDEDGDLSLGYVAIHAMDVETFGCPTDSSVLCRGEIRGFFWAGPSTWRTRHQGWYDHRRGLGDSEEGTVSTDSSAAIGPFGEVGALLGFWDNYSVPHPPLRGCIERNRPDELIGYVDWVIPLNPPYPYDPVYSEADWQYDHPLILRVKFDAKNDDYCGEDPPFDFWLGSDDYDTGWPWEDITDPAVREALHDAYVPCEE